jgi:hypothetical protein
MRMRNTNVPLEEIVWNPHRDMKLFPIDQDHVAKLRDSINEHGFFGGIKARRRNGVYELACGHHRVAAARKAKGQDGERLTSITISVDDMDDDTMIDLMARENATQSGGNPGAVMSEVVAATRRLIEGLTGTIVPVSVAKAFESKSAVAKATGKLRNGRDVHLALGHNVIRRYLGQGNAGDCTRSERQIREAISALKQSGVYDDIVEEALRKVPPPASDAKPSKSKEIEKTNPRKAHPRILDERSASIFDNEHQFAAFREAVTTHAAQKVLPVDQQLTLARKIMSPKEIAEKTDKKRADAGYIKRMVQFEVEQGMKQQREIDREEKERYLTEQREVEIDQVLTVAKSSLRSLNGSLVKLMALSEKYPYHPKVGGFSAKLDDLVNVIQQLSRTLKR